MGKDLTLNENKGLKDLQIPAYGFELIRHIALPDLLGGDSNFIQYYMGKSLARKFPLKTLEEMKLFFIDTGFGNLELIKEKKGEYTFQLTSPLIKERFSYLEDFTYRLEAGFIAEQLSIFHNQTYECLDEIKKRKESIYFYAVHSL